MSNRFVSEDDFVANRLIPDLKEAAKELKVDDVLDFHKNVRIDDIGWADVTLSKGGNPILVVEAKFKKKAAGGIERDIEPRDPDVVKQAVNYAAFGGFPFYATCNTNRLILYHLQSGKGAFESEVASYEYSTELWATSLLKFSLGLQAISLKAPDDSLVSTLKEAYADIWPEFLKSLKKRLSSDISKDKNFTKKYKEWLEDQGQEFNEETHRKIAQETAYLQINKLVFYKVIRNSYPKELNELKIEESKDIQEALQQFYKDVLRIDYKAVYQSDIISEIPLTTRVDVRLRTLIDTLNEFDFAKFRSDFVGRVYEKLIPPQERKDLGQFYTPPAIIDLITRLTIKEKDDDILDPGCGSGGFLVGSYHRLSDLNGAPSDLSGPLGETIHKHLLTKIYGVDINQFPAHLSVINLAVQNTKNKSDNINVVVKDFFDVKPGVDVLSGFGSVSSDSEAIEVKLPSVFDSVVANPPYIRQELLGSKEKTKIRRLIENEYRSVTIVPAIPKSNKIFLDKQSDIYVYFFMHGLAFLKDKGELGFIASNKWLEVAYGEPFQRFLLENCNIEYVIEFDRAVFADAEVNTAVVILKKEKDKISRNKNIVKFARLKQKMSVEQQHKLLTSIEESYEDDTIRINTIRQADLKPGKWNVYLRAPPVFRVILTNNKMKPLSEFADIKRAPTTGYNKYFILNSEVLKEWKIEKRYLKPCISSPKDASGLIIDETNDWMLMVDENMRDLKGTRVYDYLKYGENLEIEVTRGSRKGTRLLPKVETLATRKPYWYSLPQSDIAPILFPRLTDVKPVFLKNKSEAVAPHVFYYMYPKEKKYVDYLLAYLNSSLAALFIELWGRSYGGGVLELLVYEMGTLPVVDPKMLDQIDIETLGTAFRTLAKSIDNRVKAENKLERYKSKKRQEQGLFETEIEKELDEAKEEQTRAQKELDKAIYDILSLSSKERKQIESGLMELQEIRRLRAQV